MIDMMSINLKSKLRYLLAQKILLSLSFILWIITITKMSLYFFPADALYFVKSLPATYWIGIAITLYMTVRIIKGREKSQYVKLGSLLLLVLYLHGITTFTLENAEFQDVYTHMSGSLSILKEGNTFGAMQYTQDNPNAFIFFAMLSTVINAAPITFVKFYDLFTYTLLTVLVYVIADRIVPRSAPIVSFAFVSVLWPEVGHLSPQGVALPAYLIALMFLIRSLDLHEGRRTLVLIALVTALGIPLTNATTGIFMLFNLLMFVAISRFKLQRYSKQIILTVFSVFLVILLGTYAYTQQGFVVGHLATKIQIILQTISAMLFHTGGALSLPKTPEFSYFVANITEYFITGIIVVSGILFSVILFRLRKKNMDSPKMPLAVIASTWFFSSLIMGIGGLFGSQSATFVIRSYCFALFPWLILCALFISPKGNHRFLPTGRKEAKLVRFIPKGLVVLLVAGALLMPIAKYGVDPVVYLPTSTLYASDYITKHVKGTPDSIMLGSSKQSFTYYTTYNEDTNHFVTPHNVFVNDSSPITSFSNVDEPKTNRIVALSHEFGNGWILRTNTDIYNELAPYLSDSENLIFNDGSAMGFQKNLFLNDTKVLSFHKIHR